MSIHAKYAYEVGIFRKMSTIYMFDIIFLTFGREYEIVIYSVGTQGKNILYVLCSYIFVSALLFQPHDYENRNKKKEDTERFSALLVS